MRRSIGLIHPRRVGAAITTTLAVPLVAGLAGCQGGMDRRYLTPEDGSSVWALTFAPDTEPFAEAREGALYIVEAPVEIPIRAPRPDEERALGDAPWAARGDFELEITFTVTNLDTTRSRMVSVTFNGINPDYEYQPGFSVDEGQILPDFSQWERTYLLGPGESRTQVVREEEIDEITVDLAAATSTPECQLIANRIVHPTNQADRDPQSIACIPEQVPSLVAVRLGLRAVGDEPPPIALEASARARDLHDRLASGDEPRWEPPTPTIFTPAPPED